MVFWINNVKFDIGNCNGDSGNVSIPYSVNEYFAIRLWLWLHSKIVKKPDASDHK